jgi:peptidoglycan/LPS O-acetylase OafA/YrhL
MKRILQLDGVRALAFLVIFFHHALDLPLMWAGVDVFFVLSGFLITSLLMEARGKEGAWSHFYERRALRILPPLTMLLIIATFVVKIHWGWDILWYLGFAQNFAIAWNKGPTGLGILWSLAVEEQFYLFWPFIALNFEPRTVKRVAIGLVILAPVLRGIATPFLSAHWPIYYLMPFRMDLLASGAILSVLWRERGDKAMWRKTGVAMMAAGVVIFALCVHFIHGFRAISNILSFNVLGYSLICCVATGLIAFTLGTERGWWMTLMSAKPVRAIGLISYTGYLIHPFAIGLVVPFGSRPKDIPLALIATLIYASLSWWLIERPILRLRPGKWLRDMRKPATQPS